MLLNIIISRLYLLYIITFMKKTFKILALCGMVLVFGIMPSKILEVKAAPNNVPEYYYANYRFINDWNKIRDIFDELNSRFELGMDIDSSYFRELSTHFRKSFPFLTNDFKPVYEKCTLLAEELSSNVSKTKIQQFLWNSCQQILSNATSKINWSYTVRANATANPNWGMAPITITFDARNSIDPSSETIPTDNFYWYYRDENGVDTPMWKWSVISYEFKEAGNFIVHLVVRSSNVTEKWILDWERDLTINVAPKAANIVVYANTRRMYNNTPIKMWISEWAKWVVFDWSATMPRWSRKILSHKWTITNDSIWFSYSKSWEGTPSYINVPIEWNWEFKVTLSIKDNENNSVSESFYLYLSAPVTVIKQTPSEWTTSTTLTFDWSASYSITNRINTYLWEIFDENGDKQPQTFQGKKISKIFVKPWNYLVRLTVTDMAGNQNVDIKEVYVESTTPTPQFTVTATSKRKYPSEFTLDASNSTDIDVLNEVDSLEYSWRFSTENYKIISTEDNNRKIVVQFNEVWKHTIKLIVTDQYGKFSTITKTIEVQSTLRPEIEVIPWPITWWKILQLKSTVNRPVINYVWSYWDWDTTDSQKASDVEHRYRQVGIYDVNLTVYDTWWSNTVTERVFIGETDYPIAAYRIKDSWWFYIQALDVCPGDGDEQQASAYSVNRYANFTINPSISVNTKWNSAWLAYVFEPESILWTNQAVNKQELTHKFSQTWCHYVDLTVKDTNIWKQDKVRIWFNVKNALPKIKNITITFPQYSTDNTTIWFSNTDNSNKSTFNCDESNNLQVKVTAVNATDSDWSISRLRFYYYNIDDPSRILEYKEARIDTPYVYFSLPRIKWEYKFWVMVYDNDGWMIDTEEYLWSNPSVYFENCTDSDVPTVTLKISSDNIQVGDEVIYTIVSKIASNNEDFTTDKTFYYDFTWDGTWDLVTKKDSVKYTFMEPYEDGITPRAAVEYRWKLWKWDYGGKLLVRNGIKPQFEYNSIGNTVIIRDLSIWIFQQRKICFDVAECNMWNSKYQRTHIVTTPIDELTWWTQTKITENDSFIRKYEDYWSHDVSLYLKNKYWNEDMITKTIKTTSDTSNGRIAPWINMITIPATTFNNANPEIFLSKSMKNSLLMYINNESWETCYVDTDISNDSDGDWKSDNDVNIECNKMAKIMYQPNYESAIGRIYFINDWKLTFKNFYVTFEWYILELDEEKLDIYNDITILINWIEDSSVGNTDLKSSLDVLRKNLNNITVVSPMVLSIKDQLENWWIIMDANQKDLLDSVLDRLSNSDTIISVWKNEYEKNKQEILAILPASLKAKINWLFDDFEEKSYDPEGKAETLLNIWNTIIQEWKKNKWIDDNDIKLVIDPAFCSIFEYYDISRFSSDNCSSDTITKRWNEIKDNTELWSVSNNSWWLPWRLKIILIILIWWLLVMWWVIVFFSIKARLNSWGDTEDEW